ncbi:hypothetical protein [Halobaculum rubrum]|uniref:hypothetical protein n=1 Tax=Halobaculum rubrum TaxID=2872158 RepID=UPI001CA42FCD|nr:hypothetical protein [Halobaculum rubrum]QZX98723.1 hypothetical protein K6T25_10605 [Halobaculum rubrum]
MTDGEVRVSERGEEAVVEAPSLNGEIFVDLDSGVSGQATVHAPTGTKTVHDDGFNPDSEAEDEPATDGGYARPTERLTLRGTGITEEGGAMLAVFGVLCLLSAFEPDLAPLGAAVAGIGLAYIGARAKFSLAATGGDDA